LEKEKLVKRKRPHILGRKAQYMLVLPKAAKQKKDVSFGCTTWFSPENQVEIRPIKPFGVKTASFHWKFAVSLQPNSPQFITNAP